MKEIMLTKLNCLKSIIKKMDGAVVAFREAWTALSY